MADAPAPNVTVDRKPNGVATIVVDRPAKLNALDGATLRELKAAGREAGGRPEVRVLVITGSGEKAFSAGADIAAMAAMPAPEGRTYAELGHAVMAAVEAFRCRCWGSSTGRPSAGGLRAGARLRPADRIVSGPSRPARDQPRPHPGLRGHGAAGEAGGAHARARAHLPGHHDSRRGRAPDGPGDACGPARALPAAANELAEELARKAPVALRQAKRATAMALEKDTPAGCRVEVEAFAQTFASDDRVEGLRAFLEKRNPAWRGRRDRPSPADPRLTYNLPVSWVPATRPPRPPRPTW
jgi:enoyl-CoA hydratase